ncbi:MAG: hypothetical protein AB1705_03260 [Verrucomicrobiota bacterium]
MHLPERTTPHRLPKWQISVVTVLVVLLAAGALLQWLYPLRPLVSGWRSLADPRELNQSGFRGRPFEYGPQDFVILLVGDSQVQADACLMDEMPEARLQRHLNALGRRVKVFSIGAAGFGQDQQLLMLREYFQLARADLVVLWETPGNDVWNNVFPTHWPDNGPAKPTFWLENGELRGPSEPWGASLDPSSIKLVALLWRALDRDRYRRDDAWESRLPAPYQPMSAYDGPVSRRWQEYWDAGKLLMMNFNTEKNGQAIELVPRSPRTQYGIDLTRKLLEEIRRLVEAHRGKLVLFHTQAGSELTADDEQVYVLNGRFYRASRRQAELTVREINEGFVAHHIPVTLNDWQVGPYDSHLNPRAVDQVMRDLAARLAELAPVAQR